MRTPVLDKNFYPMIKALNDFDAIVKKNGNSVKVTIVAERSGGYNYVYSYDALPDGVNDATDRIDAGVRCLAVQHTLDRAYRHVFRVRDHLRGKMTVVVDNGHGF